MKSARGVPDQPHFAVLEFVAQTVRHTVKNVRGLAAGYGAPALEITTRKTVYRAFKTKEELSAWVTRAELKSNKPVYVILKADLVRETIPVYDPRSKKRPTSRAVLRRSTK